MLTLRCPAKVNFLLSVGAIDPSDPARRHGIASWMAAVNFGDDLTLEALSQGPSSYDLAYREDAPAAGEHLRVDWPLEKDLGYRAHQAMQALAGRELPIRLTLRKRIPPGAGLGGGSSDAGAVLAGVNRIHGQPLSEEQLHAIARTLGSDVSFALSAMLGTPSAVAHGFGEKLEPLKPRGVVPVVLAFPPFGCPTGAVYRAFDELAGAGSKRTPELERVRRLAGAWPVNAAEWFNDLAEPAFRVTPPLRALVELLRLKLGQPVHVTGSGSTLFAVAKDAASAEALAQDIRQIAGIPAVATATLG